MISVVWRKGARVATYIHACDRFAQGPITVKTDVQALPEPCCTFVSMQSAARAGSSFAKIGVDIGFLFEKVQSGMRSVPFVLARAMYVTSAHSRPITCTPSRVRRRRRSDAGQLAAAGC